MLFEKGELPDELVQAHRDGSLVLFVGSGVSVGPPSSLPDFACLAKRVIAELEADREFTSADVPERVLGELEDAGFGVHAAVHRAICEADEPNRTHRAVAQLALSGPPARVVTTNFDRLLSSSGLEGLAEHTSPHLPDTEDIEGIVYLHGSVAGEPESLVVTQADFARVYMSRDSPTLVFLQRLFTSRPVLFIGYSANDVLMNYILRAARGKAELYSLRSGTGEPYLDELGIIRIPYGTHADLPVLLEQWSEFAGASPEHHRERVGRIVTRASATSEMTLHEESYLTHVVADPELIGHFTSQAHGAMWSRWTASLPTQEIFDRAPPPGSAAEARQVWLSRQAKSEGFTADDVALLCDRDGGSLPEWVWSSMFNPTSLLERHDSEVACRCLIALADIAPPAHRAHFARAISSFMPRAERLSDEVFVELAATWCEMVSGLVGFRNRHDRASRFWSDRPHVAAELMSIVDSRLRRADRLASIYAGADMSLMRTRLVGQRGGDVVHRGHLLVDAAKDLIMILIEREPRVAAGYLDAWAGSPRLILNRLALYGWAERTDETPADKLAWLAAHDRFVDSSEFRHETEHLISKLEPAVPATTLESLRGRVAQASPQLSGDSEVDPLLLVTDSDDVAAFSTNPADNQSNPPAHDIDDQAGRLRWGSPYDRRQPLDPVAEAVAEVCRDCSGPNADEPWPGLRSYVASCSEFERIELVEAVAELVYEMSSDERAEQWHRWMRVHWRQRLASDPVVLTDLEATAFTDWAALVQGDAFTEAAEFAMSRPTGLRRKSLLPRLLLDAADAGGTGVIGENPHLVALLLAHMLSRSMLATAKSFQFALPAVRRALAQCTQPNDLAPLNEQMARVGIA